MIHEAYMPVYMGSRFLARDGTGPIKGSTRGPRGPKNARFKNPSYLKKIVLELFQSWPKVVPKLSQSCAKVISKLCQSCHKGISKMSQSCPQVVSKLSQSCPLVPKCVP